MLAELAAAAPLLPGLRPVTAETSLQITRPRRRANHYKMLRQQSAESRFHEYLLGAASRPHYGSRPARIAGMPGERDQLTARRSASRGGAYPGSGVLPGWGT